MCYGSFAGKRKLKYFAEYVKSKIKEKDIDLAFKMYVTESLRLQGENKYIKEPFIDIVKPPKKIDARKLVEDFVNRSGIRLE